MLPHSDRCRLLPAMTTQNDNSRSRDKEAKLAVILAVVGGVVVLVGALVESFLVWLTPGDVLVFLLFSVAPGVIALFCGSMLRRWPLAAAIGLFVAAMVLLPTGIRGYPPTAISCTALFIAVWLTLRLWLAPEERGDGEPKAPES